MPRRFLIDAGVLILFIVLTIVLTWPLGRLLTTAVVYPGDPLINSWIVAWNVHALATDPAGVYDANIFFPSRYALTFSENLFGLWPFAAALSPFLAPLTIHNVLMIAGIALTGFGAYVFGRSLTGSVAAGLFAGIVYGFSPWRFVQLPHLQYMWGGWLPLMFAALLWYDRSRRRLALVALAFFVLMNGLTNLHLLVFGAAALALAILLLALSSRERRSVRYLGPLLFATGAALLVLVAVLWPYRVAHRELGVRGSVEETDHYSASLRDWTAPAWNRSVYPKFLPESDAESERHVFPGAVALLLALGGIAIAAARRRWDVWLTFAALLVAAGVVLSVGRAFPLYAEAFDRFDFIRSIRVPARWSLLGHLGLALLGASAIGALARRRASAGAALAMAASILALAEVHAAPLRWFLMPPEVPAVYRWLKETPFNGGVLELPIGHHERDYHYLYGAALHFKPTFNGASGFAPPLFRELTDRFGGDGVPEDTMTRLESLGGSVIVVHANLLTHTGPATRAWLRSMLDAKRLGYAGYFENGLAGDYVFTIRRNDPDVPLRADDETLRKFLDDSGFPPHERPFGYLQAPLAFETVTGRLEIRGWALSPRGIRSVKAWFANRRCSVTAETGRFEALQRHFPDYSVETALFAIDLDAPPCAMQGEGDILIELTDHGGQTTLLPHVWFTWKR